MKYPYAVPAELARQPWWPTARDLSFDAVLERLGERDKFAARTLLTDFVDLYQIPASATAARVDKVLKSTTLGDWSKAWKPLKGLTAFGRLESLRGAMAQLDHLFGDAPPAPPAATLSGPLRAMQLRVLIDRVRSEGVLPPYSAYHLATALGPTVTVGEAYDSATCTIEVRGFIEAMDRRLNDGVATGAEARAARLAHWQREAPARGGEALLALQAQLAATEMPLDEATRARLHSRWTRSTDRYEVELAGAFTCLTSSCHHVDIMFTGDSPVVRCERGTLPCRAKLAAVNNALDTLIRDDEHGHALRDHLRQPAWQRMLDRLRLAAVGPVDKRKVGWVLKLPNELALCWLEPKKSGGLKASKLTRADLMDYETERHEDLLALQLYRSAAQHWDVDSLAHVLSTFTNRDGLYARSDLGIIPVRVRVAEPRVEVVPAPGGSRVVVRIGDSPAEVSPPYRASWTMTIDPEEGLVYLAFWTRATRIAWEALNSNTTIPAEATGPLTDTLLGLGSRVAVKKDASWLGRPFAPDSKVSFRLGFEGPRGARQLAIEGRVQPVAELGALVPGVGEALIPVRREGEVGHVARDFSRELELVSDAAQSVGLGADEGDATWRVKGLDEAMAIWNALTLAAANDPTLEVVWANKTPSVQRSRGVDKLALRLAVKRDWLDVRGGFQLEGGELPIAELLDALRDKKRFIEVDDGRVLEIGEALSKELAPLSALVRDNDGGIRTSVLAAPIIAELAKLGATIEGPPEWLNASKRLTEAASLEVPLPAAIDAVLRPYQLEGLTWAARLAHWARGACLADEMGLGKTLQALALIAHRRAVGPVLVVAPTSVVPNWLREARRFAPSLDARAIVSGAAIDVLDGLTTKNTRGQPDSGRPPASPSKRPFALLVTSWDLVVRHEARFGAITWGTLVLDEAHAMKNSATKRAQVIKALPADFVLALTGTPVENRPSELWSLFQAIAPGLLGSAESFRNNFGKPIAEGDNEAVRRLSRLVRPFVLRRTKANVALDLPEKTEVRVDVVLSQPEREHYEKIRRSALAELAKDAAPLTGLEKGQQVFKVLVVLTRLRQLACHPRLVDPSAGPGSAKLDRLVELVSELRDEGRKVLVFSQFTELLSLVRTAFDAAKLSYAYLDGQTAAEHRMREVDLFQSGERDAFLLSLKAGGVGLNLTAASEVIHLDPWWNPAVEDQATGRAHRIGQAKPVTVYRLVTQGTVEEQILALHADKRTMVAGLLDGTGSAAALTADELMALLSDEGLETEPAALETEAPPVARAIVSSALAQPETPAPVPVDVEPKEPTFTDERIVSPAVPAPVTTTPPRITPLALVLRALQQSKTALKRADIIAATNVDEALWPGLKVALESDDNVELSGQARGRAYRWIGPVSAGS